MAGLLLCEAGFAHVCMTLTVIRVDAEWHTVGAIVFFPCSRDWSSTGPWLLLDWSVAAAQIAIWSMGNTAHSHSLDPIVLHDPLTNWMCFLNMCKEDQEVAIKYLQNCEPQAMSRSNRWSPISLLLGLVLTRSTGHWHTIELENGIAKWAMASKSPVDCLTSWIFLTHYANYEGKPKSKWTLGFLFFTISIYILDTATIYLDVWQLPDIRNINYAYLPLSMSCFSCKTKRYLRSKESEEHNINYHKVLQCLIPNLIHTTNSLHKFTHCVTICCVRH